MQAQESQLWLKTDSGLVQYVQYSCSHAMSFIIVILTIQFSVMFLSTPLFVLSKLMILWLQAMNHQGVLKSILKLLFHI